MRRLYYLVSTAGIPNLGDELIAATWLAYLAEAAPDADVVLDCVGPDRLSPSVRALHPRLRTVSTLWQICFRHWEQGVRVGEIAAGLVAAPEQAGDLRDGIDLLHRADVVHLTGGGFLNGIWPAFAGLLSGIGAATAKTGALAAMTGVGLLPAIDGNEDLVGELAAAFDVADVRDAPSARLLGTEHSCDDAFLTPERWRDRSRDLPEVMVSLQSTRPPARMFPPARLAEADAPTRGLQARAARAEQGLTGLMAFLSATLELWGVGEIGLVECWPEADKSVWARAERLAPRVRRYALDEVLRDGFPAAAGQCWLSTRFHPHLFAAAAGASGVAISLMKGYYDTKHGSLLEQGSAWTLASYRPFDGRLEPPRRPSAGGFEPDRLAALRTAKLRVAQRIYDAG